MGEQSSTAIVPPDGRRTITRRTTGTLHLRYVPKNANDLSHITTKASKSDE